MGYVDNAVGAAPVARQALSTYPTGPTTAATTAHNHPMLKGGRLPRSHSQLREPCSQNGPRSHFHLVDNALLRGGTEICGLSVTIDEYFRSARDLTDRLLPLVPGRQNRAMLISVDQGARVSFPGWAR